MPSLSGVIQNEKGNSIKQTNREKQEPIIITLYKFRWYILITECMLNLTNSFIFSSYAAVANYTDDYYGESTTDYLSMVFLGVSVPSVVVAICVAQKAGLRLLIISSAFLNALGAGVRLISNVDGFSDEWKLTFVLLGQALGAMANPGTLFLNTKIAATWFPTTQRAFATALLSVSTPLGMLITGPMASAIVRQPSDMGWLNLATFVPSAFAFLMTLLIRNSSPKTPPSNSCNEEPMGTFEGIRAVLTNRSYLILTICLGITLGLYNTLYTMIAQILCTRGYSDGFSGFCIFLLVAGGLLGSTAAAVVVDRTKRFEEVLKITLAGAALCSIAFAEMAIYPDLPAAIAVSLCLYGTLGLSYYAVAMETSAEITYPAAETTSAGIIGLVGQLCGTIFIAAWNSLSAPLQDAYANIQTCTVSGLTADKTEIFAKDMTVPIYFFHIFGILASVTLIMFFKPKYRRIAHEEARNKTEKPLDEPREKSTINIFHTNVRHSVSVISMEEI